MSTTSQRHRTRNGEGATSAHVRQANRSLVLGMLFRRGAMSRADLARGLGLTRPTVSNLVAELAERGVVEELGLREDNRVGKPATLIDVRRDSYQVVSLDLSAAERFTGVLVDLRGGISERIVVSSEGATGEYAVSIALRLAATLIERAPSRILGIGVGTPGVVDGDGVVVQAGNLRWSDVPLRGMLAEQFGVPVEVENDANCAAKGFTRFHENRGRSLMVITIEHGVGSGLVLDGELVVGHGFSAGEIGHVTIDEEGAPCACGRRGCLEVLLGASYLRSRLSESGADRAAILREAGRALGIALAPVVSALNLDEVVLSGSTELTEGTLLESARETVTRRTLTSVGDIVTMRVVSGDSDLIVLGAAAAIITTELGVS